MTNTVRKAIFSQVMARAWAAFRQSHYVKNREWFGAAQIKAGFADALRDAWATARREAEIAALTDSCAAQRRAALVSAAEAAQYVNHGWNGRVKPGETERAAVAFMDRVRARWNGAGAAA